MDIMLYVNLFLFLISFIAIAYATDLVMTIKGELDDLRKE